MNPVAMALIIVTLNAVFAVSAWRRFNLAKVGAATWESRLTEIPKRLGLVWTFAFYQKKMRYYLAAGLAHQFIFLGFVVLLLRTLVLWGRGFSPTFNLFVLGHEPVLGLPLGAIYGFFKDVFASLVLLGVAVFVYFRVVRPQKRMTLGVEGLIILGIISTMMLADLTYDGASTVLAHRFAGECGAGASGFPCSAMATLIAPLAPAEGPLGYRFAEPAGSLFALLLSGVGSSVLVVLAQIGFWTHSSLVLIFLNLLPYTKHFHIITAIPNVFLGDTTPRGPFATAGAQHRSLDGRRREGDRGRRSTPRPHRLCPHRALHVEGHARFLHLHRVRALLGQLPGFHHRQAAEPQAIHARFAQSPVRPPRRVPGRRSSCRASGHRACAERGAWREPQGRARHGASGGIRGSRCARRKGRAREGLQAGRPSAGGDSRRRAVGLHHLPRMRRAVPGEHHLRRQDRADAPQPRGDQGRVPESTRQTLRGHGEQRQPVEPGARRSGQLVRGPRREELRRQTRRGGFVLGRLRRELRRPSQENSAQHRAAAAGGRRRFRDLGGRRDVHR